LAGIFYALDFLDKEKKIAAPSKNPFTINQREWRNWQAGLSTGRQTRWT
jgi:hypothetical protein